MASKKRSAIRTRHANLGFVEGTRANGRKQKAVLSRQKQTYPLVDAKHDLMLKSSSSACDLPALALVTTSTEKGRDTATGLYRPTAAP